MSILKRLLPEKAKAISRISLNPFGLWPEASSRICNLGGAGVAPDPAAVFHTAYMAFESGSIQITCQFDDLEAQSGTLTLNVMSMTSPDDEASIQTRATIALTDLVHAGGRYTLPFIATAGKLYAIYGRILDTTDTVSAAALSLHANQPADAALFEQRLARARDVVFPVVADPTGMIVHATATLAKPMSQMCTVAQFDEPDYSRWLDVFHRPMHRHRKQWEYVYIARTLEYMGMLKPLARGLGFGCGIEPLPAAFASMDIFVTASDLSPDDDRAADWRNTNQHTLSLMALGDTQICRADLFFARVEIAAIDMNQIPEDRRDYDFCWSSCALEHLGSIKAGLAFIERSLHTLRPGGVAVHTTELNLTSNTRTIVTGGTVLFRRRDIEELANRLRAAGHSVTAITFDQGDQPQDHHVDTPPYSDNMHFKLALGQFVSTSFGLIVRKAG